MLPSRAKAEHGMPTAHIAAQWVSLTSRVKTSERAADKRTNDTDIAQTTQRRLSHNIATTIGHFDIYLQYPVSMRVKMAVAMAAIAFVLMASIPLVPSDGLTEDEFRVSIPEIGYDSSNPTYAPSISIESNSTKRCTIYLTNSSSEVIAAVLKEASMKDVATISPESGSIDAAPGKYASTKITVKAAEYVRSGTYIIPFEIYVQSLSGDGKFIETVEITLNVTSTYSSDNQYNKFFGLIPNTLDGVLGDPWFPSLVTMVILLILNVIVCYALVPLLTRLAKGNVSEREKVQFKRSVTKITAFLMFVYSLNLCAQIVGADPSVCYALGAVSTVSYVIIGSLLAWRIYTFILHILFRGVDSIDVEGVDSSLVPLFKMLGKIAIAVAAVTVILASFGVDLAGILMSAGVVTLGITMGAQNVLGQFFSGIVLLATRPFRKGDYIKVNGTVYIVKSVKLMFTELYTWEVDQTITMPNNVLTSATISNVTKETNDVRIYVYMSIAYEADLELAKKLMIQAANEHPHVVISETRSAPSTRLTNFLDSGIEIRLAAYVDDFDSSGNYAGELRERMLELFKENGVEIPYTKYEVTIMNADGKKRPGDNYD